jgi:outer membrane protein
VAAAVIPTDRVSLEEIPEEKEPVDELGAGGLQAEPGAGTGGADAEELTRSACAAPRTACSAHAGRTGSITPPRIGGAQSPKIASTFYGPQAAFMPSQHRSPVNRLRHAAAITSINSSAPDKGVGFNVTIPIRNRPAQAQQAQALIEYRQAELRLEQLYTQIRISVVNAMFALTNDRAQVQASIAAKDYARAEPGCGTEEAEPGRIHHRAGSAAAAQHWRAENTLLQANATYAKDRAALYQTLASTLQHYGIDLNPGRHWKW